MKNKKRVLSLTLALIMVLTMLPVPVFAADRTGDFFNTVRLLTEQYAPVDGNQAGLEAYGAGVCAFLLTVPNTDNIYPDEIMEWLQATLGGDEAMGWTGAAFDSWSNGDIGALQAHASGYGEGVTLGMEPVDYGQPAEPEITMSAQEAAERDAAMAAAYGIAPAAEVPMAEPPMAPPADAAMSVPTERPDAAPVPSSGGWNGVWVRGGDTLAIVRNGASMFYTDGKGYGFSISTMQDEVTDNEIHSRMYDPSIEYEAEYHLILSGDTLEFTHIYYGASPITTQASGTYTRTGEDADAGYNRLRNKPAPAVQSAPTPTPSPVTVPITPTQPMVSVQPAAASSQQSITVAPTPSKVFVNGVEMGSEAYNILGNNYFKLRDIAFALNGTAKQFNLSYDSATAAINIITGSPYIPVGGEMMMGDGQSKTATLTPSKIYLNGGELYLTVYSIGGNNFFKLADLMGALNVGVIFNQTTGSISLDTNANFMGVGMAS